MNSARSLIVLCIGIGLGCARSSSIEGEWKEANPMPFATASYRFEEETFAMVESRGSGRTYTLTERGRYKLSGESLTLTTTSIDYDIGSFPAATQAELLKERDEYRKRIGKPISGTLKLTPREFHFFGKESDREIQINLVKVTK